VRKVPIGPGGRPRRRRLAAVLSVPLLLASVAVGGVAVSVVAAGSRAADAAILPPPEVVSLGPTKASAGTFMGGRVENLSISPLDHLKMIAASEKGGLFKSTDGGGTWSHFDSLPVNQLGKARYADHDLNLIVVSATADYGSAKGGVWISNDRGVSWTRPASQDGHCASDAAYGVDIMQLPQSTTELIQVGTACGILTSTDLGGTFTFTDPSGKNDGQQIWDVHARVVAAGVQLDACGQHGFFRAIRGSAWSKEDATSPFEGQFACTVATAPDDANTVFGASFGGGPKCSTQLQESDDAWRALAANTKPTWTNLKPCLDQNGRPPWVITHPSFDASGNKINETFEVYFGDSTQILHQTCSYLTRPRCKVGNADNATNWDVFDRKLPHGGADPASLLWTPLFPGCPVFESGDGGIFRNQDCAATPSWADANTGVTAQDVRGISGTASTGQDLYFATQDNGFYVSRDGGANWQIKFGGDGYRVFGDATGPNSKVAFATNCCLHQINENFDLNTDNWWNKQPPLPPGTISGPFIPFNSWGNGNYAAITSNGAGTFQLYQTTNSGQSWSAVGAALPAAAVDTGGIAQLQVSVLPGGAPAFFMRLGSRLYRMTGNGAGATIQDLGAGANVAAFAVDPVDPTRVYAVAGGQMMRGTRTGAGINGAFTWARDTNLENLVTGNGKFNLTTEVTAIAFDPTSTTVVVGTLDQGIKLSANGGTNWYHMRGSGAVPNIIGFSINPVNGNIYAGSSGRGIWQVKPTSRLSMLLGGLNLNPGWLRTLTGGGLISLSGLTSGGAAISAVDYRFYKQGTTAPAYKEVSGGSAKFHLSGSNGLYVVEAFTKDNAGSQQIHQRELVNLDNPSSVCSGSGTLQGTFIFDLETCKQSTNSTGDLWWEQIDDVRRQLVPFSGGDQVAVLGQVDFTKVTFDQIAAAALGTAPVNGSNDTSNRLTPGTVLAVRTRHGDYAKVRVDTYGFNLGLTVATYKQPVVASSPPAPQLCSNAGTLQGTFILDVEGCQQSADNTGDLWWEQIDDVRRQLVPWSSGDSVAVLGKVNFGAVGLPDLLIAPYDTAPVNGSNDSGNRLTPGTVLAVHTRNGHYAKVRVDTYGYNLGLTIVTYQ